MPKTKDSNQSAYVDKETGLVTDGVLYLVPMQIGTDNAYVIVTHDSQRAYDESLDTIEAFPGDDIEDLVHPILGTDPDQLSLGYNSPSIVVKEHESFSNDQGNAFIDNPGYSSYNSFSAHHFWAKGCNNKSSCQSVHHNSTRSMGK